MHRLTIDMNQVNQWPVEEGSDGLSEQGGERLSCEFTMVQMLGVSCVATRRRPPSLEAGVHQWQRVDTWMFKTPQRLVQIWMFKTP